MSDRYYQRIVYVDVKGSKQFLQDLVLQNPLFKPVALKLKEVRNLEQRAIKSYSESRLEAVYKSNGAIIGFTQDFKKFAPDQKGNTRPVYYGIILISEKTNSQKLDRLVNKIKTKLKYYGQEQDEVYYAHDGEIDVTGVFDQPDIEILANDQGVVIEAGELQPDEEVFELPDSISRETAMHTLPLEESEEELIELDDDGIQIEFAEAQLLDAEPIDAEPVDEEQDETEELGITEEDLFGDIANLPPDNHPQDDSLADLVSPEEAKFLRSKPRDRPRKKKR